MKIGVFGDSFACSHIESVNFAWYILLATKLGGTVITKDQTGQTHGIAGIPTFVSYKLFLHNYKNYDYVIFLCCDPAKYTKRVNIITDEEKTSNYVSGFGNIEWYLRFKNLDEQTRDTFEKLKMWYMVSDNDFMETAQDLILQDVKSRMHDKCIMLPVTEESMSSSIRQKLNINSKWNLWDFHRVMSKSLDSPMDCISPPRFEENRNRIACHLTEEANNVLANSLYDYITNKTELTLPSFIQHNNKLDYYYTVNDK